MKIGIMQPYFFPYIGYFNLISEVDTFVLFDCVQYIDKGWLNRNRLLHPSKEKGYQYFNIPLVNKSNLDLIEDIKIGSIEIFFKSLKGKLTAFKKAPYYGELSSLLEDVEDAIRSKNPNSLSAINRITLESLIEILDIDTKIISVSEIEFDKNLVSHAGQWALEITERLGGNAYINPISGKELFYENEFKERGISLRFIRPDIQPYRQFRGYFEAGLSILDVILWNGIEKTKEMVKKDYKVEGRL